MRRCRWNEWNLQHIAKHGVNAQEVEFVVNHVKPPFPRQIEKQKFLVQGQTAEGRYLHVIFVVDPDDEFDFNEHSLADILQLTEDEKPRVYVIHARDLTRREKLNYRRSR